jgi:hypothetical protein
MLLELAVGAPARPPLLVEHHAGRPRGPLVDRQDHPRGRYLAPGSRGAANVAQLARTVEKATRSAPGDSMLQRELELPDATPGLAM